MENIKLRKEIESLQKEIKLAILEKSNDLEYLYEELDKLLKESYK